MQECLKMSVLQLCCWDLCFSVGLLLWSIATDFNRISTDMTVNRQICYKLNIWLMCISRKQQKLKDVESSASTDTHPDGSDKCTVVSIMSPRRVKPKKSKKHATQSQLSIRRKSNKLIITMPQEKQTAHHHIVDPRVALKERIQSERTIEVHLQF